MMEAVDRTQAPAYNAIDQIKVQEAERSTLKNGVPVYTINAGDQALVKIEFLFGAGAIYQEKPLIAGAVNTMIDLGTSKKSAQEIAEQIDYYGAYLEADADKDNAIVTLYSLNKHLEKTLPIFQEVLMDAVFPEEELQTHLQNRKQRFVVNQEKVDHVARKYFNEYMFGKQHAYGYNIQLEDYDQVQREDLLRFYQQHYCSNNLSIIVSGKVEFALLQLLDELFGGEWSGEATKPQHEASSIQTDTQKVHLIEKEGALQSAIRMGRPIFNKKHEDYAAMTVLNTVLGATLVLV